MDIIYADTNRRDLDVLMGCEMDLAFGKDENDFSVTLELSEHCCKDGYFVYIENTEYGGIIDSICPDSDNGIIEYKGRTWHGILEHKVLEPDAGQDYLIADGEANTVLRELIDRMGLSNLFKVSDEDSGIRIRNYQFPRYIKGYTGIRKMLQAFMGKLTLVYVDKYVTMSAVPLYDYSQDEEWDTSQLSFQVEKNFRPVNHLICLGRGELKKRKIIHLFLDSNGGIQPYAKVQNPYMNEHYILDKSQQKLFVEEEKTDILDFSNAETRDNYILLSVQPQRWADNCTNYFIKENDSFKQVELEEEDGYTSLVSQPSDWTEQYANYFYLDGEDYKSSEGIEVESYELQKIRPNDWNTNYEDYFQYYSDGLTWEYRKVSAVSNERYVLQTMKPSDWETTYKTYYKMVPVYLYVYTYKKKQANGIWTTETLKKEERVSNIENKNEVLIFRSRIVKEYVYKNLDENTAPTWKTKKFYTKENYNTSPQWKPSYYYTKKVSVNAPAFESGKYYKRDRVVRIPKWKSGTYYQLFQDDYAALVESGIEKMMEYADCDMISSSLNSEYAYDIGDIVGAVEKVTGMKASQPVTKKIVNISKNMETITYEIGE